MKRIKECSVVLLIVSVTVFFILGCSSGSGAPSNEDVKTAYMAMGSGLSVAPIDTVTSYSGTGPYTYSASLPNPSGGSAVVSYSSATNPTAGACTITGTVTLTNWRDTASGYTLSGTVTVSLVSDVALNDTIHFPQTQTVTMSCNLALAGGPVSTLSCNITMSTTEYAGPPYFAFSASGTITANGYVFDITKLQ